MNDRVSRNAEALKRRLLEAILHSHRIYRRRLVLRMLVLRVFVSFRVLNLSRRSLGVVSLQTGASFPRRGELLRDLLGGVVHAVCTAGSYAGGVGGVRLITVQAMEQTVGQRVIVVQNIQVGLGLLEVACSRRETQVNGAGRQDASRQQVFSKCARYRHGTLLRRRGTTLGNRKIVAAVLLWRVERVTFRTAYTSVLRNVTRRVIRAVVRLRFLQDGGIVRCTEYAQIRATQAAVGHVVGLLIIIVGHEIAEIRR